VVHQSWCYADVYFAYSRWLHVVLLNRILFMTEANTKQADSQRPSPEVLQSLVIEKQQEEAQLRLLRRK